MSASRERQGRAVGFAGLSSLVSDINVTSDTGAEREVTGAGSSKANNAASLAEQPAGATRRQAHQASPESSQAPGIKTSFLFIILVVLGLSWLGGSSDKNTRSQTSSYSPARTAMPGSSTPPAQANTGTASYWQNQSTTPGFGNLPTRAEAPSRETESKPSAGQGMVLSTREMAYCVAEEIRMEGAKSALDHYRGWEVDRFNSMIDDYNDRCSNFRYRRGALESVRSSIESYRSELYSEGRARFGR